MKALRNNRLCRFVLVFAFLFIQLPFHTILGSASGAWYVSPIGNDQNPCSTIGIPCASIQQAIDKAAPGDTIYVAIGTYTGRNEEIVKIFKNLTLSGGWDATFKVQNGYSTIDGTGADGTITVMGIKVEEALEALVERFIVQKIPDSLTGGFSAGIYNSGMLTLKNSIVQDNLGNASGGGISNSGVLYLNNCTIRRNWAYYGGGGIYNNTLAKLDIISSTISDNSSTLGAGGIESSIQGILTIQNSLIRGNQTHDTILGGGGLKVDGEALLKNVTISYNNSKGIGGGIYKGNGNLRIEDSAILYNTSDLIGGGIFNGVGNLIISNSQISHNSTKNGGGVYNQSSNVSITNSTINANTSSEAGGGIYNGVYGTLFLNNTTITRNQAGSVGGGIANTDDITLQNTILADNAAAIGPNCHGDIGSTGYNLVKNTAGCNFISSTGDLLNKDPSLIQEADLLGYYPLPHDSPAVDAGNPGGCIDEMGAPLPLDQRGAPRQGRCDIGSYEYTTPGSPEKILAASGTPQSATTFIAFKDPLQAVVLDKLGSPVDAIPVTFTAPSNGASGIFLQTGTYSTTLQTNQGGLADAGIFTANGSGGGYEVIASIREPVKSVQFSMNNIAKTYVPVMASNFCANFNDDFSNPASGWLVDEDEYARSDYLGGEYRILSKKGGYLFLYGAPACARQNYVVQADVRWEVVTGNSYGLIFGIEGAYDQFYVFDVNTDFQMFRLYRYSGGSFISIVTPTSAAVIHYGTAPNHLKVTRNGAQITLEINGTVLGTWMDSVIGGYTHTGLMMSTYEAQPVSDARFDNYSVTDLPSIGLSQAVQRQVNTERTGSYNFNNERILLPSYRGW